MSSQPSVISKQHLRQFARERRFELGDILRAEYSEKIMMRLRSELAGLAHTDALLAYRSLTSEVDTSALFDNPPCVIYAPRTHSHTHMEFAAVDRSTEWQTGIFGIQEPTSGALWEVRGGRSILICPLTAFDRNGNRLGMGKGCFDIWLAEHRHSIDRIIGLAFSCQEVEAVPAEAHDIPLDLVITEKENIACRTS